MSICNVWSEEKKAGYLLPLKGNPPVFYEKVRTYMDAISSQTSPGFEQTKKVMGALKHDAADSLIPLIGTRTKRISQTCGALWLSNQSESMGTKSKQVAAIT